MWSLMLAGFLAAAMGFFIQRGGTCMVAAVEEVILKHRANRIRSLCQTALLVTGIIICSKAFGFHSIMPTGYSIMWATIIGSIIIGLGAYFNQSCMLGTIAHIGSGDWDYLTTPIGFFIGAYVFYTGLHPMAPTPIQNASPLLYFSFWWILPLAILLWLYYIVSLFHDNKAEQFWKIAHVRKNFSHPANATVMIGVTSIFMTFIAGQAWAYTSALTELAQNNWMGDFNWRIIFLLLLFLGAVIGGISGKNFSLTTPTLRGSLRCFLGGLFMSIGSLMIPGSNDQLILVNLPLLWPFAWLAFLTMCISIAICILAFEKST